MNPNFAFGPGPRHILCKPGHEVQLLGPIEYMSVFDAWWATLKREMQLELYEMLKTIEVGEVDVENKEIVPLQDNQIIGDWIDDNGGNRRWLEYLIIV